MNKSGLRAQLLQTTHLPPLSATAGQLLEKAADPDVELEDLALIIGVDPGLAARIIGLSNAACFGQSRSVTTLNEAIVRVGLARVRSIALSIALSGAFDTRRCPAFDLQEYWSAALGCAELARMLSLKLPTGLRPDPGAVYLCGLLHNLGALIIASVFPAECSKAYRVYLEDRSRDISALEREYVGINRRQAMEWLGIRWRLPGFVLGAACHYADMNYRGPGETLILVVGVAARSARGALGDSGGLKDEPVARGRLNLSSPALARVEHEFEARQEELWNLSQVLSQGPA